MGIDLTPMDLQATLWNPEYDPLPGHTSNPNKSDALNMAYDTAIGGTFDDGGEEYKPEVFDFDHDHGIASQKSDKQIEANGIFANRITR